MSNCLVTGGAGFIASHVVDLLVEEGHEVAVIDDLSTGKKENLNPKAKFYEHKIQDKIIWNYIDKFDYVFHLAALARIQPSIDDPVTSHETNFDGTLNILEYCKRWGSKLIFSSSSSIYDDDFYLTDEETPADPKNPYALQKWMSEEYIKLYGDLYGLDYTILRYYNVFGERQLLEGAYASVVGIFLKQKQERKSLTITGDGEQERDFVYVKDVARANLMAMDWQGIYNIGSGENCSINELADMVGGKKKYIKKREGEAYITLANNDKAHTMGWKPTKSIKEWVSENLSG